MRNICDCGNVAVIDGGQCEHCEEIDYLRSAQTRPHTFHRTWLTGNTVCEVCNLMPSPDDYYTDCVEVAE